MGTTFFGTTSTDVFINDFTIFQYKLDQNGQPDLNNPIDPSISTGIVPTSFVTIFADNAVSYAFCQSAVAIDLGVPPGEEALQHGGYAEGDILRDVFEVEGSLFNDIIRGSDSDPYFDFAQALAEQFIGAYQ